MQELYLYKSEKIDLQTFDYENDVKITNLIKRGRDSIMKILEEETMDQSSND